MTCIKNVPTLCVKNQIKGDFFIQIEEDLIIRASKFFE